MIRMHGHARAHLLALLQEPSCLERGCYGKAPVWKAHQKLQKLLQECFELICW